MNYTENYHLPQWEETDRIMRVDFNQMCADMEAGMNQNAQAAAELPYVVGSYTGDGQYIRDFYLGFHPRFVIICGNAQNTAGYGNAGQGTLIAGESVSVGMIFMTDTGFQYKLTNSLLPFPKINESGRPYGYIAFR